jgi:hypothetical protein
MIELLAYIIIVGLASYRLTYLWRYDLITEKLREKIWFRYPPAGELLPSVHTKYNPTPVQYEDKTYYMVTKPHWFGELTHCHWCISGWFTLILILMSVSIISVSAASLGLVWLSAWGVACFMLSRVT